MKQRTAARTDGNQAAIVAALAAVGASVWVLGLPIDLLVGFRGADYKLECKMLVGKRKPRPKKHTDLQHDFITTWRGAPTYTVTDADSALRAIGAIK